MSDGIRFSWDDEKAALNLKNHQVSFEEAATVFQDPNAYPFDNGSPEGRLCIIGFSIRARLVTVVYDEDEDAADESIRIISAWLAEPHERRLYAGQGA